MFNIDYSTTPVTELFGTNCFNERAMKEFLPSGIIERLCKVRTGEEELTLDLANGIAKGMKEWALSKGATHFTHWFQPLTGLTAEKHDSFISPKGDGIVMEFSGKELLKGEGDASAFPNGGLRNTFEARGYTAFDTSSCAFIRETAGVKTLYIPTAFFSYNGEALDKKVPLLRSIDAIEKQTLRVLRALGNTTSKKITVNMGPEQEYFLVDRRYYERRPDLKLSGRTVLGNISAKGQEMNDHYYGSINARVTNFMNELNYELWKLGIFAKTQHKEAAPNQFEIAVIYDSLNISTDHNQLLMDVLQSVALRHDMVALLHEKPFYGVNGSGKHDNWSLSTDDGLNLFSPGSDAQDNVQFLLFLTSFIKAVDLYAPLLRCGAATSGNDHRLGAAEAPPAIISIYLGGQLEEILDSIATGKTYHGKNGQVLKLGVTSLPKLPRDLTDRNRTSPLAFTGNKFEFRMPGSSQSMAGPNIYLNTMFAHVMNEVADRLEVAHDVNEESHRIIREFYKEHKRIVFNGNGYGQEWIEEAKRRGLPNYPDTVSILPTLISDENVKLFEEQHVFSLDELRSRMEIYLQTYSKQINIEASVMVEMVRKSIIPAVIKSLKTECETIELQNRLGFDTEAQKSDAAIVSKELNLAIKACELLHVNIAQAQTSADSALEQARCYRDSVLEQMQVLRSHIDILETYTDKKEWPYPSYEDLMFTL